MKEFLSAEFLCRLETFAIRWQPLGLLLDGGGGGGGGEDDGLRVELITASNNVGTIISILVRSPTAEHEYEERVRLECDYAMSDWDMLGDQMVVDCEGQLVSIKIKCRPRIKSFRNGIRPRGDAQVRRPMSACDLQSVSRIECLHCRHLFYHHQSKFGTEVNNGLELIRRCVDLPSENWQEFFDCWMCHPDEEQHAHMSAVDLMSGKRGVLMSGSTYLLLHGSQLSFTSSLLLGTVTRGEEEASSQNQWHHQSLKCPSCLRSIGQYRLMLPSTINQDADQLEIKLWKYAVSVRNDGKTVEASFVDCLLYELFELGRANASFRFIIKNSDADGSSPVLLLWIFNWDTKAAFIDRRDGNEGHRAPLCGKIMDAVRVHYVDLQSPAECFEKTICTDWLSDSRVETLAYPRELCEILGQQLNRSNRDLPTDLRLIRPSQFRLAFLGKS